MKEEVQGAWPLTLTISRFQGSLLWFLAGRNLNTRIRLEAFCLSVESCLDSAWYESGSCVLPRVLVTSVHASGPNNLNPNIVLLCTKTAQIVRWKGGEPCYE